MLESQKKKENSEFNSEKSRMRMYKKKEEREPELEETFLLFY